jgi:hypothetical protein
LIWIADFVAPMAWCRSNRSAAHAIGVFIPTEVLLMPTNFLTKNAAASGTMNAQDARDRQAGAARAQAELIEILARLVLE